MKKLAFIVVLVFVLSGICQAEILKDLKIKGDLVTHIDWMDNYKGSNKADQFSISRLMVYLSADLSKDVGVGVCVGRRYLWGTAPLVFQGNSEPSSGENLYSFLQNTEIYNAYVIYKNVFGGNLSVGRQFFNHSEEDAVFYWGPQSGRFLAVTSIDGMKWEKMGDPLSLRMIYGKRKENSSLTSIGSGPDTDNDIFAIEATKNICGHDFEIDFYGRRKNKNDVVYLPFLRAKGPVVGDFGYKSFLGVNFGKNKTVTPEVSYEGWIGRMIGEYVTEKVDISAGYVYVSGDTTPDNKDKSFVRISRDCFLSMAYIVYEILNDTPAEDIDNVAIPFLITEVKNVLGNGWDIGASYSDLTAPEPRNITGGGTASDKLWELDLYVKGKINDSLSLKLLLAQAETGNWFTTAPVGWNKDPIRQAMLELKLTF